MTKADIDSVEVVGNGWRTPRVQERLNEYLSSGEKQVSSIP